MLRRSRHEEPDEQPPLNREGSPYAEVDLDDPEFAAKVGRYYIDLKRRHEHWKQKEGFMAPELRPTPTTVELKLLDSLLEQDGRVNFWDVSGVIGEEHNGIGAHFDDACETFVHQLGLTVQTVPESGDTPPA